MGKEEKYSVLLASSNEKFDQMLMSLLPTDEYGPIHIVNSIGAARRMMTERTYVTPSDGRAARWLCGEDGAHGFMGRTRFMPRA